MIYLLQKQAVHHRKLWVEVCLQGGSNSLVIYLLSYEGMRKSDCNDINTVMISFKSAQIQCYSNWFFFLTIQ